MAFTAKDVQALRETTGCGMMDCKKALTEADGDMEKAVELLREKGLAASQKKAGRIAAEGTVYAVVDAATGIGAIIEVNAETDFVAKNEKFMDFVKAAATTVVEKNPTDVEALLGMTLCGQSVTVEEALRELILVIGENMKVRRFVRYQGNVVSYVHGGGRIGVLARFALGDEAAAAKPEYAEMAKDVAMQIAAIPPAYLNGAAVPAEVLAKEKEILKALMDNDDKNKNKPEAVKEKILEGQIKKYLKENCLVDQAFIKDGNLSVSQFMADVAKKLGTTVEITEFVRFEKGEGIEKRDDNFADEVASMMK